MDDVSLLQSYVDERSEAAFRELVCRHLPVVHAAALRQVNGDAHLAQDVAQRVFIALARKASTVVQHRSLVGWLYTAARFEAVRAVRSELRRRRREEGAAAMNVPDTPEPSFEQLRPILDDAMSDLGRDEREVVLLRFFSGRSFAEIGSVLRVSEDAARKRVDRALERLRVALGRRGFASTAAALGGALNVYAAPGVSPAMASAVATGACQQLAAGTALPLALLMSSTKSIAVAAGLVAFAGALIWSDHRARQNAEQALAADKTELAAAEARQIRLAGELADAKRALAAAEASASVEARVQPPTRTAPAYLSDPAYRDVARAATKARRHLEFQRLYRNLNLTPAQIERFEAIMVRQDEAKLDAESARATGGDEKAVYERSGSEWSGAMHELLGTDGFNELQGYLRAMPVRAFIDGFAVRTAAIGAPLSSEQSDQLATLALANDVMFQQGKGTDPGTVNWNAVWDPAARLLRSEQLALLQRTVEVWTLQKQIALRLKSPTSPHP